MLAVSHVTKSYTTTEGPLTILHDVSFTLEAGQSAAIMGPSGSGKSTLLYTLGALEPPTSGTVSLHDQDPYALDERALAAFRNRHIGFVFQDHSLLPQCSVLENVLTPTLVAQTSSPKEFEERARLLLEQVGLTHRLTHRPSQLSGGEKQRVAIARALVQQPTLLLCDEPTGNLDRRNADTVADMLLSLHVSQQTILVLVTHSVEMAQRFGQRFAIANGELVAAP